MEYITANIIGAIPWLFLFLKRKDLRKPMLIMSLLAMPIAFFDLFFVPSYWIPKTLFNLPIGIEGFLFSFEFGGLSAAIFAYLGNKKIVKTKTRFTWKRILPICIILPVMIIINVLFPINITVGMHIGLLCGTLTLFFIRKDLLSSMLVSSLSFTTVYLFALLVWTNLFPHTVYWFTFENLPKLFIHKIPVYELTFALLFGAYWGNLYEMLFGYTFTNMQKKRSRI